MQAGPLPGPQTQMSTGRLGVTPANASTQIMLASMVGWFIGAWVWVVSRGFSLVKEGFFGTIASPPGVFDSLPGAEITQTPNNEETRNQAPV